MVSVPPHPFPVGTDVCLWSHSLGRWVGGYSIAEALSNGYRLLRRSDGSVSDEVFSFQEVMQDRRNDPMRRG